MVLCAEGGDILDDVCDNGAAAVRSHVACIAHINRRCIGVWAAVPEIDGNVHGHRLGSVHTLQLPWRA